MELLLAPFCLMILLVILHSYLGMHVIARDVIFIDISLSQVAAVGGALTLLIFGDEVSKISSFSVSLALCLIVALILAIYRRFEKTLSQEVLIGMTYALASGVMILILDVLPHGGEHLKQAMMGNILFVTWNDVFWTGVIYFIVGAVHFFLRKKFWLWSRGEEKSWVGDFLFYFLLGVVITFSTHHAGVLVVFSILVAPAAFAWRYKVSIARRWVLAMTFGIASSILAFVFSVKLDLPIGPSIVALFAALFFITLSTKLLLENVMKPRLKLK